jgi:predicted branched-subunit amino acid permease
VDQINSAAGHALVLDTCIAAITLDLAGDCDKFRLGQQDNISYGMDGTGSESGSPAALGPGRRISRARWLAFLHGVRETPLIPPFILCLTFLGFGALASETGISLLNTLFMAVFIFALPGQVVLVDEMARGASVVTAAIAVTATAVRLLPMTVSLLPVIRDRTGPKWLEFLVAYFVAITYWVEAMRRTPRHPRPLRAAYTLGIAAALVLASSIGAAGGFLLAANVPRPVAAALLFLTPMYFLLSLVASSRSRADLLPIAAGLGFGPVLHLAVPDWDLLLTGLVGGTLSFAATRWWRRKARP